MNPNRKWRIELTEEQLSILTMAVEDWHRFLCGQCELDYATSYIDSPKAMHLVRKILSEQVKPEMFPELESNESYSWCGGHKNPYLNKAQAISYLIYKEIRHQRALADNKAHGGVDLYDTLTCEEQGPMIKVEPINE